MGLGGSRLGTGARLELPAGEPSGRCFGSWRRPAGGSRWPPRWTTGRRFQGQRPQSGTPGNCGIPGRSAWVRLRPAASWTVAPGWVSARRRGMPSRPTGLTRVAGLHATGASRSPRPRSPESLTGGGAGSSGWGGCWCAMCLRLLGKCGRRRVQGAGRGCAGSQRWGMHCGGHQTHPEGPHTGNARLSRGGEAHTAPQENAEVFTGEGCGWWRQGIGGGGPGGCRPKTASTRKRSVVPAGLGWGAAVPACAQVVGGVLSKWWSSGNGFYIYHQKNWWWLGDGKHDVLPTLPIKISPAPQDELEPTCPLSWIMPLPPLVPAIRTRDRASAGRMSGNFMGQISRINQW